MIALLQLSESRDSDGVGVPHTSLLTTRASWRSVVSVLVFSLGRLAPRRWHLVDIDQMPRELRAVSSFEILVLHLASLSDLQTQHAPLESHCFV